MRIINVLFALIIAVGLFLPFNTPVQSFSQLLGATNAGNINCQTGANGFSELFRFQATSSGTIQYIKVYTLVSGNVKVGIYSDSGSYPNLALAVQNGSTAVTATGWNTIALSSTATITSGTWYWLAVMTDSAGSCALRLGAVLGHMTNGNATGTYAQGLTSPLNNNYSGMDYQEVSIQGFSVSTAPTVDTLAASLITTTTATGNGNVTGADGQVITEKGICYKAGSSGDPTTADSTSHDHIDSVGAYTEAITGLTKGTTYRVRAYAINATGTGYGTTVDMTTLAPTVTTQVATSVTPTGATGNGNITSNGGEVITEKGICYKAGVAGDPTTADSTSHDHVDSTGAYTEAIAGLTKGTAYRLRAYIISASGTVYGVTVDLVTINDPTITTSAASLVSSTTARLNSQVTFDGAVGGGEACTITFAYIISTSPHASYNDCAAGTETTVTIPTATYILNQTPYLDITGLTAGGTYYFATRIYNSTGLAAHTHGAVLSFTTSSGISDASGLTAIPTATTISLAWVKGLGAGYTLVRYLASSYPATVADGALAYLGVGNSYMLTGLTPGTTYYFSAWGKTGALYASGYATAMATTLAFDSAVSTGTLETPPTNSLWNQTPSTAKVSNIPLISGLISANATAYSVPETSLWYFLWILFSVGIGVFIYSKSGNNLPMSLGAQALLFALGAILGLVMLWIMVLFMIIGAGFSLWGDRR